MPLLLHPQYRMPRDTSLKQTNTEFIIYNIIQKSLTQKNGESKIQNKKQNEIRRLDRTLHHSNSIKSRRQWYVNFSCFKLIKRKLNLRNRFHFERISLRTREEREENVTRNFRSLSPPSIRRFLHDIRIEKVSSSLRLSTHTCITVC